MDGYLNMHTWYGWCGMAVDDLRREQLFPFKPHVSQVETSYMITAMYPRQLINTPLEEVYVSNRKQKFLELETLVNRELRNVNEWLKANKLSLNIVIFRPRQKNMPFIPVGLEFLTP